MCYNIAIYDGILLHTAFSCFHPELVLDGLTHVGQQMSPQAPITVEGVPKYVVEEILDSHL